MQRTQKPQASSASNYEANPGNTCKALLQFSIYHSHSDTALPITRNDSTPLSSSEEEDINFNDDDSSDRDKQGN